MRLLHRSAGLLLGALLAFPIACSSNAPAPTDKGVADLAVPPDLGVDVGADQSAPDLGPDSAPPDLEADSGGALALSAGAASVDITPAIGVPLGGFGGAPRRVFDLATIPAHVAAIFGNCYDPSPGNVAALFAPSTGKHDPLTAKSLVLDNGQTKAAIIKVDAIGLSRTMRTDVEAVAVTLGIPKENLLIVATHTHSGTGAVSDELMWQMIAMDCFHAQTYQTLLKGITDSLKQANAELKPAKLGVGTVDEKTVSQNRADMPGIYDPQLGVFKVVDAASGAPIAALLNFAIHGTCLGASNMEYSADVMGYTERALETRLGGGVAIFMNGAEGDVSPSKGGHAGAQAIGDTLSLAADTLWKTLPVERELSIAGTLSMVQMPAPQVSACLPLFGDGKSLCDYLGSSISLPIAQWLHTSLPFGALRLGDVVFAAVPGEAVTQVGWAIKDKGKALGFRYTFVAGLANEHMGYIATNAMMLAGTSYESQSTLYGPNTDSVVINAADAALKKVVPPPQP